MKLIDADELFKSFESEENPEDSLWTLYGIKRKIEDAPRQEPCEDAISRKDLLSKAWFVTGNDFPIEGLEYITKGMVENMPPVTPKQKMGHWIFDQHNWHCSECGESPKTMGYVGSAEFMAEHFKYCNHCGLKMVEPQESEGEE